MDEIEYDDYNTILNHWFFFLNVILWFYFFLTKKFSQEAWWSVNKDDFHFLFSRHLIDFKTIKQYEQPRPKLCCNFWRLLIVRASLLVKWNGVWAPHYWLLSIYNCKEPEIVMFLLWVLVVLILIIRGTGVWLSSAWYYVLLTRKMSCLFN